MFHRFLLSSVVLALASAPASAQDAASDRTPPAHVSLVEGMATLGHDATTEELTNGMMLVAGDRVRTDGGRVEIVLPDGSLVFLDERTTLDVVDDWRFRLVEGRAYIYAGSGAVGRLALETPGGLVHVQASGEYQVTTMGADEVELAVARGYAELVTDRVTAPVRSGQRVVASAGHPASLPESWNSARWDGFLRWSQARIDGRRGAVESAQHLPAQLAVYGPTLATYGSWGYAAPYGYVWYPRVAVGWRPYFHGRWGHRGHYGWGWVGFDAWAWPTHYYGRWGISAGGAWFWSPGTVWGPSWVSWAYAPGYVSWCPLGWNNRPVAPFWGHRYAVPYGRPGHGWTVVPREHFGRGTHIRNVQVDGGRLVAGPRAPAFAEQSSPPVAVPRGYAASRTYRGGPSEGAALATGPRSRITRVGPGDFASGAPARQTPTLGEGRSRNLGRVAPATPESRAAMAPRESGQPRGWIAPRGTIERRESPEPRGWVSPGVSIPSRRAYPQADRPVEVMRPRAGGADDSFQRGAWGIESRPSGRSYAMPRGGVQAYPQPAAPPPQGMTVPSMAPPRATAPPREAAPPRSAGPARSAPSGGPPAGLAVPREGGARRR